jgi:hypothetical protein
MWELRKIMSVMRFKTAFQQFIANTIYLSNISDILHNANMLLEILRARGAGACTGVGGVRIALAR